MILDDRGRAIRTYQGTHEVDKKQEPYLPEKAGLDRFVWDWTIDGPTKWFGAAKKAYQGSNDGPVVPPGQYTAQLTLGNTTFTRSFVVKADPRTLYTQQQLVESYEFARSGEALFSHVDAQLDALDSVKTAIADATAAAKKAGNTQAQTQLAAIDAARETLFSSLTANYQNDEDSIQMPGKVREDVQSLMYYDGTVITPAIREYDTRVRAEARATDAAYERFKADRVPELNHLLETLKIKPVTM